MIDIPPDGAYQGDLGIFPVAAPPSGLVEVPPSSEGHVVAHSETGHHHVIEKRHDIRQFSGMDMFRGFLEIAGDKPAELVHLRDHHTHAPQVVAPGAWLIQRQAAYTPQGWERARD